MRNQMDILANKNFKIVNFHRVLELKPLRWVLARVYLPLSALVIAGVIAIVQLLVVGGFDRLGASPQFSFLTLNLLLIAVFATVSLYPFSFRVRRAQRANLFDRTATTTERAIVPVPGEIVCKLLIIRRISRQHDESTSKPFNQRSIDDQIIAQN
jgi:hypothetical protein